MLIIRKEFMDNTILKQLLTEYDAKRIKAFSELERRKNLLRDSSPEYVALEKDLQSLSLDSIKSMLKLSSDEKESLLKSLEKKTFLISDQKKKLLKKLNLPENYLLPHFDCLLCQDTGYLGNSLCSCIKQHIYDIEYNKSNIGNVTSENFEYFNFDLYSSETKADYNSQYSPRENIEKIVDISRNFIKNFDSPDEKNLMFLGPTGLGKTFLSNCIAKELLDQGKTVLYQTSPVMLDEIIKSKFEKNSSDILEHILNVDLLIIDDLGTETMNTMKFTELFTIINTRLLNQSSKITKTIISTNMDLKDIFTIYNERIGSRLVGNYKICRFFGDDIRLKSKK